MHYVQERGRGARREGEGGRACARDALGKAMRTRWMDGCTSCVFFVVLLFPVLVVSSSASAAGDALRCAALRLMAISEGKTIPTAYPSSGWLSGCLFVLWLVPPSALPSYPRLRLRHAGQPGKLSCQSSGTGHEAVPRASHNAIRTIRTLQKDDARGKQTARLQVARQS